MQRSVKYLILALQQHSKLFAIDSNGTDRNVEKIKRLKYTFGTHINTQLPLF